MHLKLEQRGAEIIRAVKIAIDKDFHYSLVIYLCGGEKSYLLCSDLKI